MKKRIWKFECNMDHRHIIGMPAGAVILRADHQKSSGHDFCIWALVDEDERICKREFAVFGTGHPVPDCSGVYVSTFLLGSDGYLVFHVFDLGELI